MERKLFLGQFLIWVILLLGQLHGCKSCIEKEREALLELKRYLVSKVSQSIDVTSSSEKPDLGFLLPTWTINDTKSDCCRWKGIKCNRTSRRVIELSLGSMHRTYDFSYGFVLLNLSLLHPFEEVRSLSLTGEVYRNSFEGFFDDTEGYESLKRLRNLKILDLSFNGFNNSIYPFLNAATSLTTLFLPNNYMEGVFPIKELKDLTNLELLDLNTNQLTSSVSVRLTPLKKLKSLDLSYNSFYSSMELKVLKDLANLEHLDLSGNNLNGSIPELTHLKKLKSLNLSSNNFSSPMELQVLNDLTNLEQLRLSINFLKGSMPEFTHLKKLKYLDLRTNAFSNPMELEALKHFTNLEQLSLRDNFLNGHMPVLCELKNLRELDLSGNQFTVQLPYCLGSLNKLRVLDLSSNQLRENLPPSFSSLESLEYLSLLDNNFLGFFSLSPLANLTKLKVLKLSSTSDMVKVETESTWQPKFQLSLAVLRSCSLEKTPSFLMYQKNLRLLDLSNNRLTGDMPTWLLANNTELEVLQLQNNSFTTFEMPTIVHNLQVLDCSANDIGRLLPDNIWRALPYLVHMNGSYNVFEGQLPSSMGDMRNITFLDLSYNNFSGKLPRRFVTGFKKLGLLKLSHNKFSGHFLLRGINLFSVDISNNLFTGNIRDGLRTSTILSMLDMSNNRFKGAIPSWISQLSNLKFLLIARNFLEGTIPPSLLRMSFLDLSANLLSGALPSLVDSSTSEKYLFLHNNNLTGPIPDTLLGSVQILDLRNNKFSGSIPRFVNTQDTRILLLKGNNLTGPIPRELCDLSNIRLLDISDNKLNGVIPSCLYNLSFGLGTETKMVNYIKDLSVGDVLTLRFYESTFLLELFQVLYYTYQEISIEFATKQRYESYIRRSELDDEVLDYMYGMDLSNNGLSGVIPPELGNLSRVRALNLSHNLLLSSIPFSFSNLKAIESLDLSYNKLHGSIPHQLTSLTSLAVLDVSYNNLSGIIPQGRQFNTFNEKSYLGNPFLCGPPINRSCEAKKSSEETDNEEEKEDEGGVVDMLVFYYSTASTYSTVLIGIVVLMCFDCRWGRAWIRIVDAFIALVKNMLS